MATQTNEYPTKAYGATAPDSGVHPMQITRRGLRHDDVLSWVLSLCAQSMAMLWEPRQKRQNFCFQAAQALARLFSCACTGLCAQTCP